jgi:hypothetical protein
MKVEEKLQASGCRIGSSLRDLRQETRGNFGFWYLNPEAGDLKPEDRSLTLQV